MLKKINNQSLKDVFEGNLSSIFTGKGTKIIELENDVKDKELIRKYLDDNDILFLVSNYYSMEMNQLSVSYLMKNVDRKKVCDSEELKKISALFEKVRIMYNTKEKKFIALSVGQLKKEAIEEFGAMVEEKILNPEIVKFLKIGDKKKGFSEKFNKRVSAFEYFEEEEDRNSDIGLTEIVDHINSFKAFTNSDYYYMPFEGWSIEEVERNEYLDFLKSTFERVIV